MDNYTTTSGFSDLVGSCEIDGSDCNSYHSNSLNMTVIPQNTGGPFLQFIVQFPTQPPRTYVVNAGPDSPGMWSGFANNGQPEDHDTEEPWGATAVSVPLAATGSASK